MGLGKEDGRQPNDLELLILMQLDTKLYTRLVSSPFHTSLLQRYTAATNDSSTSEEYFRSGGQLGLECLVYFVETYPGEANMMNRPFNGYNFIMGAMGTLKMLCAIYGITDPYGKRTRGAVGTCRRLYWQLLSSGHSFYQLFSFCFVLMDEIFCEERLARWKPTDAAVTSAPAPPRMLAQVLEITQNRVLEALEKAPMKLSDLYYVSRNAQSVLEKSETMVSESRLNDCFYSLPLLANVTFKDSAGSSHPHDVVNLALDTLNSSELRLSQSIWGKDSTTTSSSTNDNETLSFSEIPLFKGLEQQHNVTT